MKRLFLIKKKGFNHFTGYTELYLHRSFETKNYFLVKEESKSLFDVFFCISDEKYMTAFSPYFDALSEEEADEFAQILSYNFKSEVCVVPYTDDYVFKGPGYKFMFSDRHNAFLEDPYVYHSKPEFVRRTISRCVCNEKFAVSYTNYGGAFSGIKIRVSFDIDSVELEEAFLGYYVGKQHIRKEIVFQKHGGVFECIVNYFSLEKGINKYSAKLRGKKEFMETEKHGFWITFTPKGNVGLLSPKISVSAL